MYSPADSCQGSCDDGCTDVNNRSLLGSLSKFSVRYGFLRSQARLRASHFSDSFVYLFKRGLRHTVAWYVQPVTTGKDLDTDSWFEVTAQSSAVPHMTIPCVFASSRVLSAQVALHATSLMALSLTPPWHSSSLIPGHFGSSDRWSRVQLPFNRSDVSAQLGFIELLRRKSQCVVPAVGAFLPLADWPVYGSNGGRSLHGSSGAYVSFRP